MAEIAALVSIGTTIATTAISAASTIAGGNAAYENSKYVAGQYKRNAQQERAASQRSALETRKNARLAQSTLQARAAASGGGADDPTVLGLSSDIAERGEYQSLMEMFTGESRARGLMDAAASTRAEGKFARNASRMKALGTIIGGAGSAFGQFGNVGGTGPVSTSSSVDPWAGLRTGPRLPVSRYG